MIKAKAVDHKEALSVKKIDEITSSSKSVLNISDTLTPKIILISGKAIKKISNAANGINNFFIISVLPISLDSQEAYQTPVFRLVQ